MNVDATLEDLEAQAYFASIIRPCSTPGLQKLVRVNLVDAVTGDIHILLPLFGQDFIAGFHARPNCDAKFCIFPMIAIKSFEALNGVLERTAENLESLLSLKLIGSEISLRHTSVDPVLSGQIRDASAGVLVLAREFDCELVVPLSSIQSISVDKLSSNL